MHCHYCGYKEPTESKCPKCSSKYIKYLELALKVEEEVKSIFLRPKLLEWI